MIYRKMILSGIAVLILLAGCKKQPELRPQTENDSYDTLHLVMISDVSPKEETLVEEAISEITREKLQINVDLETYTTSGGNQRLYLSDHPDVDLMVSGWIFGGFLSMIQQEEILALDSLLDNWGPDVRRVMGEKLEAGKWNGHIYGIPSNRESGAENGVILLKELVEKYHMDLSGVKTWEDLEPLFAIIKQEEPEVTVVTTEYGQYNGIAGLMTQLDGLTNASFAILDPDSDSLQVANRYETAAWTNAVHRAREWYQKGYIPKDILTRQVNGKFLQDEKKVFARIDFLNVDRSEEMKTTEKIYLPLTQSLATTSTMQRVEWVIPAGSDMPEKAMQMLNLMYSDEKIVNLLQYGIEGIHYTLSEDGRMIHEFNETGESGYYREYGQAGNQALLHAANKLGRDFPRRWKEKEDRTVISPAYGFTFDATPVIVEIEAVQEVINDYRIPLEQGVLEPETEIPAFLEKLKIAGINTVIAEKQRQLDAWAAQRTDNNVK